jgi:Spy/CpxP family protein refolding chaperone
MRRTTFALVAAFALAACSGDTTSPADDTAIEQSISGMDVSAASGASALQYRDRLFGSLPEELRLTDAQRAQIRALVDAFESATRDDRRALGAILADIRKAIHDGKGRDEVRRILHRAEPIHDRLAAAHRKLIADIDAVLTPEQRAWIRAHLLG